MSTKTSIKRIALVAVSALGFGLLSTMPAKAASGDEGTYTVGGMTAATVTATPVVGTAVAVNFGINLTSNVAAAGAAETRVATFRVALQSYPAGGGSLLTTAASAGGGAALAFTGGTTGVGASAGLATLTSGSNAAITAANLVATATQGVFSASWTPSVAGSYTIVMWNDANRNGIVDAAETSNTHAVTVSAATALLANQIPNSANTTAGADNSLNGVRVSSVGLKTVQVSGRTGIQVGFVPQYRLTRNAGTITANDEVPTMAARFATIAYSVTNPAGTAVTVVSAQGGTTASTSQAIAGLATPGLTSATADVARTQAISPTTGWPQKGSLVYFSAATAGTYTITAFHDANLDGLVSVGEATASSTVTVAADALPSITMTTFGSSTPEDAVDTGVGHLVRISLKNGTAAASLGASEVLTVSGPAGTVIDRLSERNANFELAMVDNTTANGGHTAANSTTVLLTQKNFDAAGNAYINVGNSTAGGGTYALTATISGGTGAGASGSGSFTVRDSTTNAITTNLDAATSYTNLTGVAGTGRAADATTAAFAFTIKSATATTVAIGYKPGAGLTSRLFNSVLTDSYGLITGLIGGQYDQWASVGTTATTASSVISWTVPVPATTLTGTVASLAVVQRDTSVGNEAAQLAAPVTSTFNIAVATAVATLSYSNPTFDAASYTFRAAVGSANKLTVEVVDQFGNALPNISVNAAIAGRNATTVIPTMLTDANGFVSYTLTDASTSTTSLTDTITFQPAAGASSSVTINYATYLPAAKITMVTPDSATATATGIAGTVKSDIDASSLGAQNTTATVSITVTDANGATLPAGVPVTFSIKGDNSAILSTKVSAVTDASGKASTSVYAWKNVNAVVTATVGSVSASGTVYFQQADCTPGSNCAEARTVATTVKDGTVTAKVTDRYGNPIKGVTLSASRVGTGTFAGASSTTGTTNAAGEVDFVLTGGSAKVTVAFATTTFGQSHATKGYVDAGITAIVASAAGTTFLAEDGVGASFDAAGVNSVTVDVTAVDNAQVAADAAADAAAEAIDAANAATDAANLAAEAADAATVAAEEARDAADAATAAVEELATQVATLMAALKAQITTLANTVAKIAKKVNA